MTLVLPYWVTKTYIDNELVLFNWTSNHSVNVYEKEHPVYQLYNKDFLDLEINEISETYRSDIEWLLSEKFLISNSEKQLRFHNTSRFNDDILHLILLPAGEACNLDCVYCYEDHLDKSRLKANQIPTLINMIKRLNKPKLHIEYFGGEPMLNMNFISKFGKSLKENNILFTASITTNGTLINKNSLDLLYEANVKSFQITLDGPKERHNLLRVSTSKKLDSFDSVSNGLRVIRDSIYQDINIILRLNVNHNSIEKYNFERFIGVIEDLIPKNDKRFFILAKPISDYSKANFKDNKQAEENYCKTLDGANNVLTTFEEYFSNNYYSANSSLLTRYGGYTCYAGNPNSLMITPDLLVRKCTVALNDNINIVGEILPDGTLLKNDYFELWTKDYSDGYCDTCIVQKSCQGNSCPLANIKRSKKTCPPIKKDIKLLTKQVVKFYERLESSTI